MNIKPFFNEITMCRNIKTLANFAPPATSDEIQASALQYVRKLSGRQKPTNANQACFDQAVKDIANITQTLLNDLHINSEPKNREEEALKAKERNAKRFSK